MAEKLRRVSYRVPGERLTLRKESDGSLTVRGTATSEAVDHHGDILLFEASVEAFKGWAGNVREMHRLEAVGTCNAWTPDDARRLIEVELRISKGAPNTQAKLLDGTLRGLSVGGEVTEAEDATVAGRDVRVVTGWEMDELSVVDVGSNPDTNNVAVLKAVGGQVYEAQEEIVSKNEGVETAATEKKGWVAKAIDAAKAAFQKQDIKVGSAVLAAKLRKFYAAWGENEGDDMMRLIWLRHCALGFKTAELAEGTGETPQLAKIDAVIKLIDEILGAELAELSGALPESEQEAATVADLVQSMDGDTETAKDIEAARGAGDALAAGVKKARAIADELRRLNDAAKIAGEIAKLNEILSGIAKAAPTEPPAGLTRQDGEDLIAALGEELGKISKRLDTGDAERKATVDALAGLAKLAETVNAIATDVALIKAQPVPGGPLQGEAAREVDRRGIGKAAIHWAASMTTDPQTAQHLRILSDRFPG